MGDNTYQEVGNSICVDTSGNVLTTGYFTGTVDFDPGPGVYNLTSVFIDVFILKLDPAGNFIWAKQIGSSYHDEGKSIITDAAGNVYVAGMYYGTVDFDPGPSTYTIAAWSGSIDAFICKLDPSGNFIWAKAFGGANGDGINSISLDATGNIYATGGFGSNVDFDPGPGFSYLFALGVGDAFAMKFDPSGNFIWAKQFGGASASCYANSISEDVSGNIYVSGGFSLTVDFDPGPGSYSMTSAGVNDAFICKLNSSGNLIWAKQLGGINNEDSKSVLVDLLGNVFSFGNYANGADLDPGPGSFSFGATAGIYFSKLDAAGNFVWAKAVNTPGSNYITGYYMTSDPSGNLFATGCVAAGVFDFDPGPLSYTVNAINVDVFISSLDPNGNFRTAKTFTGSSGTSNRGHSIASDFSGNVYTTGYFEATVDFDPGPGTYNLIAGVPAKGDIFISKLGPCSIPSLPGSISGNTVVCVGSNLNYSIAPVTGATSYSWSLPSGWSSAPSTNTVNVTSGNSGTISVTPLNICGYGGTSTLSVLVNSNPSLSITGNSSVCAGSALTLTAGGASTYTWNTSSTNTTIVVNPTTNSTYSVNGTDLNGCNGFAIKSVTAAPLPSLFAGSSSPNICAGQTTTLYVGGANTYSWNTLGTGQTPTINPVVTTTYTVTGSFLNGCSTTTTIVQNVSACTSISELNTSVNSLFIFPNPTRNRLTIKCEEEIISLELINVLGQIVYFGSFKSKEVTIETSFLASGLYYLRMPSNNKTYFNKIIKD